MKSRRFRIVIEVSVVRSYSLMHKLVMHQDTSKPRISLLFAMAQVMLTDVSATEVTVKPVTDGSSAESMREKK